MSEAAVNPVSHLKKANSSLIKYGALQLCFSVISALTTRSIAVCDRDCVNSLLAAWISSFFVLVRISELKQYIPKAGHIIMATAIFWEIGANIEWLLIGCQKNRQRPASGSSGKLAGALINIYRLGPDAPLCQL